MTKFETRFLPCHQHTRPRFHGNNTLATAPRIAMLTVVIVNDFFLLADIEFWIFCNFAECLFIFQKLNFFENPTFFSLIHLILKMLKIETSEVLIDRARERFRSRSWAVPVSWVGFPGNLNISVVMTFNVSFLRRNELVFSLLVSFCK